MTRHDVLLTVISLLSFLGTLFALGVNGMLAVIFAAHALLRRG